MDCLRVAAGSVRDCSSGAMHASMNAAERTAGVASCSYDVGPQRSHAGRKAVCRSRQLFQKKAAQLAARWQHSAGVRLVVTASASRCDDRPDTPPIPPTTGARSLSDVSAQPQTLCILQHRGAAADSAAEHRRSHSISTPQLPHGEQPAAWPEDSGEHCCVFCKLHLSACIEYIANLSPQAVVLLPWQRAFETLIALPVYLLQCMPHVHACVSGQGARHVRAG